MNNQELYDKSLELVPGGVHSPVRSFSSLEGPPHFIESANGAKIKTVEGREYIDFCMSFGPLILGHRNPLVEERLHEALGRGWTYGAAEAYSLGLAEYIISRIECMDKIRFVNSGTEAVMTAIRIARGFTGRDKIIKFNGCYHGHVDSMLISSGSGLAGEGESSSQGIPQGVIDNTIVVELGDFDAVYQAFEKNQDQIAAIVVEPLPANYGLLKQSNKFLTFLRDITLKNNALLVFDEVISGFRVAFGGMAEKTGLNPDIVTYGKVIGGGLPVGAVAGTAKVMDCLAPVGGVYQAGTLSANPLAMVAGLASLEQMTPEVYTELGQITSEVASLFNQFFAQSEHYKDFQCYHEESLFYITTADSPPTCLAEFPKSTAERFAPLFADLVDRGIYLAPNGYEVGFVSLAHKELLPELKQKLGL